MLTQRIYQRLHEAEDIKAIDVKHNVKLRGRSGCQHQIDVYWEFEKDGVTYRTAIECKKYDTKEVEVGRVRDFFGVLYDIGNIDGIMVTTLGFQSGARKYAEHYGIELMELRSPTDEDWKGRYRSIVVEATAYVPDNIKAAFELDADWLEEQGVDPGEAAKELQVTGKSEILDTNETKITDIEQLTATLEYPQEEASGLQSFLYIPDTYVRHPSLGKVKILGVSFIHDVVSIVDKITVDGDEIAEAILRNTRSGDMQFFDKRDGVK